MHQCILGQGGANDSTSILPSCPAARRSWLGHLLCRPAGNLARQEYAGSHLFSRNPVIVVSKTGKEPQQADCQCQGGICRIASRHLQAHLVDGTDHNEFHPPFCQRQPIPNPTSEEQNFDLAKLIFIRVWYVYADQINLI